MSTQPMTNFHARSELLSALVESETQRLAQLTDAIESSSRLLPLSPKALSGDAAASMSPNLTAALSSSALLNQPPHHRSEDADEAYVLLAQQLQGRIQAGRQHNEGLRRDVYHLQQRHIRLSKDVRDAVAKRTSTLSLKNGVSALHAALERLTRQWSDALDSFQARSSDRVSEYTNSAAQQRALAVEAELERSIGACERRVAEGRRAEHALRTALDSTLDAVSQRDADVDRLKVRLRERTQAEVAPDVDEEPVGVQTARLTGAVERLQGDLAQAKRHQLRFLNAYTAKFIAATMFPPADHLPAHMERRIAELRDHQEDVRRMSEAMSLLKSTIVHFDADLKKLRSVQRLVEGELENVFKVSHNELKVVVSLCLPKEEAKRFARGGHTCEEWPLTQTMLEEKFPPHKIETVNDALQEMVVAWDGMSQDAKARLTTAQDVVVNAHLLFMIACYVSLKRSQKWALKYQQVMDARLPKVAAGGYN